MKKLLLTCTALLMLCSPLAADNYDISGLWNIAGTGFAEKSFLRVSLALDGNMTLTTSSTQEVLNNAVSADLLRQEYPMSADILSKDLRFLTAYDINLKITATNLDIKAWDDHVPNGIRVPVPLPEMRPANNQPYELPVRVVSDTLLCKVTLTSTTSGKVRITGFVDLDVVGETEINSDCALWLNGTPKPKLEEETSSGCDSGFSSLMLLLVFAGVCKLVRN